MDNKVGILVDKINKGKKKDLHITDDDLIKVIKKVAFIHRKKRFGYLTEEDIESQVWVIALEQLSKYESKKGAGHSVINSIERWLNRVVKNRLNNYYRDNYSSVNDKHKQSRLNLINCLAIDGIDITNEVNAKTIVHNPTDNLIYEEFFNFIESRLPDEEYEKMFYDALDNENLGPYYKAKLRGVVLKILNEWKEMHQD